MAPDARMRTPSDIACVSRRRILRWSLVSALAALTASTGGRVGLFFHPKRAEAFGGRVPVGPPNALRVGEARYIPEGKFYLTRLPEGFLALYQKCPHMGCVISWRADAPSADPLAPMGRFACPCHGSLFDRYGVMLRGFAPRPMDLMAIELIGGDLVVDTGDIRTRSGFHPEQVLRT